MRRRRTRHVDEAVAGDEPVDFVAPADVDGEGEGDGDAPVVRGPRRGLRLRRTAWPVLVSLVVISVMLVVVFPTRTYLAQRDRIAAAETRLQVLRDQNGQMSQRIDQLHTDAEIERLAREQYNLVRPGEEAYAILPAPEVPIPPSAEDDAAGAAAVAEAEDGGPDVPVDDALPDDSDDEGDGWWDSFTGWLGDLV